MPGRFEVSDHPRLAYSVEEAAARLGCSVQHLHDLIAAGKIPILDPQLFGDRPLIPAPWLLLIAAPLASDWAGLSAGFRQTLLGLVQALEHKDTSPGHSARVAVYGTRLAAAAGLAETDQLALEFGLLMHDIGKVAIPDAILHKSGRLSAGEYQVIRLHPLIGAWLLRPVLHGADPRLLDVVLHHHERFDGRGYPDGLKGTAIPLWARICAIADAWDVMTSRRSYRSPLPLEQAVEELRHCAGTQFDPELTTLFIDEVVPDGAAAATSIHQGRLCDSAQTMPLSSESR